MRLKELQEKIRQIEHGSERRETYYVLRLVEEIGELFEAIRKNRALRVAERGTIKNTIDEELYDVIYYLLAIANLYDIDVEEAFLLKNELNDQKYDRV